VEGGLQRLKNNECTGIIPRQKSQWTTNKHLKNEGQKWKTSHITERSLTEKGC
jgi:hypothetical protein